MRLHSSFALLFSLSTATLAGCGSAEPGPGHEIAPLQNPDAGDDAGLGHLTVGPSDRIQIGIDSGMPTPCESVPAGGFSPGFGGRTYIVDLAAGTLSYELLAACADDAGVRPTTKKSAALTSGDRDALVALGNALTVRIGTSCGADGPQPVVTLTHAGVIKTWRTEAPGTCNKGDELLAPEGVDALVTKLDDLLK